VEVNRHFVLQMFSSVCAGHIGYR